MTYYRSKAAPAQSLRDYLATKFTYHSPEEWAAAIADRRVLLNGMSAVDPDVILNQGDKLEYQPLQTAEPDVDTEHIDTLLDDERMLVVAKNGSIPVAPGGRYTSNTLVFALQRKSCIAVAAEGRQRLREETKDSSNSNGLEADSSADRQQPLFLVHRIDKETSGIVVFAKSSDDARCLTSQFADPLDAHVSATEKGGPRHGARLASKLYVAVVCGVLPLHAAWSVTERIGLHKDVPGASPTQFPKLKMAVFPPGSSQGKPSCSVITCIAASAALGVSAVTVMPKTGRTHQIRLHCAHVGHPIVGDKLYATHTPGVPGGSFAMDDELFLSLSRETVPFCHPSLGVTKRHLLHASRLSIFSPSEALADQGPLHFASCPLPWFVADCPKLAEASDLCEVLASTGTTGS